MHQLPYKHQPQHNEQQQHYHTYEQSPQQQPHYSHHHQQHITQSQPQPPPRRHHSQSPYHSRHTSPYSHHSHSLHSSPHQSQQHMLPPPTTTCNSSNTDRDSVDLTARTLQHTISNTISSHASHHHHQQHPHPHHPQHHQHRRRKRQNNQQSHVHSSHNGASDGTTAHNGSSFQRHNHHSNTCTRRRRHRSTTDVSSTSINTCHEPLCADSEVQAILVRKNCCSSSRTELAQYFAEDLYGSSSGRRPSSCCTSSDYCYHTDSTSLYGSRSSLSRNNSIKSASVTMRKKRLHQRQPSYSSISLRALNASGPNSQHASLSSIFERAKQMAANNEALTSDSKVIVSPSKITIERQSSGSREALNKELPEYACSPSPIRWSFLADGKSPTELEGAVGGGTLDSRHDVHEEKTQRERSYHRRDYASVEQQHQTPSTSRASSRKYSHDEAHAHARGSSRMRRDSPYSCDFEESTTVLFHQEGEAFNNCCNNYIQCNTYLDQDLQITSEDIQQYLSKGNPLAGDILNNSKNYPFQPSNALEFQYKNNFANNNGTVEGSIEGDAQRCYDGRFRRNSSKETNLNQNASVMPDTSSCVSTPLSPTNINLSSSTNNINIVFSTYGSGAMGESNANEVKFINTTRESGAVSAEAHHSGYLPYTYPTYDYTNMSANSVFDKPIGIDEIPNNADGTTTTTSSSATGTDGQHSSSLQSPVQPLDGAVGLDSFDSFDAASDHNLLSHRNSYQFSPRSPLSPGSPATTSSISATLDNAYHRQHYYQHGADIADVGHHQQHRYSVSSTHSASPYEHDPYQQHHYHRSNNHHHHHHHHFTEGFKLGNAFKRVRKRARKYADYLRKK